MHAFSLSAALVAAVMIAVPLVAPQPKSPRPTLAMWRRCRTA